MYRNCWIILSYQLLKRLFGLSIVKQVIFIHNRHTKVWLCTITMVPFVIWNITGGSNLHNWHTYVKLLHQTKSFNKCNLSNQQHCKPLKMQPTLLMPFSFSTYLMISMCLLSPFCKYLIHAAVIFILQVFNHCHAYVIFILQVLNLFRHLS
jgi:hypothetical protein